MTIVLDTTPSNKTDELAQAIAAAKTPEEIRKIITKSIK